MEEGVIKYKRSIRKKVKELIEEGFGIKRMEEWYK